MMTTKLYSISEVAEIFKKQIYQINYLLVTGKVPEQPTELQATSIRTAMTLNVCGVFRIHKEWRKQ